jgi:tetratricopeptide (TPR) repeat protein
MRAATLPWPALIGSLALGCLLSQFGNAQWSSSGAVQRAAAGTRQTALPGAGSTGGGQVRFVPSTNDASVPVDQAATTSASRAYWTTDSLADPNSDFAITPDGEVVQTAYQSPRGSGPVLRTEPATKGSLLGAEAGNPSRMAAPPQHQPLGRSANAHPIEGRPTGPTSRSATPARITQSRTPTLAEPTPAIEPTSPPTTGNSEVQRLLVAAHDAATTAATQEDFSRVITFCRRSLAIEKAGRSGQYARQLASWAMNRRGQLLAGAGHTTEAMRDFEDAIDLDPQRWRAIHNRGVLLSQAGQFEQAFDDFSHTIQLQPDYAKAYSNRAALLVVAGRLRQAADDYRQAIDLDPNLAVAYRGRGRCCHALGQLDEALQHFSAAVELDPDNAYTIACRADLLTDLGHYAEAAVDYDRALRLDPRSTEAWRGSAWLLATCPDSSVRNPQLAVERAKTAMQLDRRHQAISYDTLAAALASAGQFPGAIETVRRAIDLAPNDQRSVYQNRLQLYEHSQPFRIAPLRPAVQANYEH